MVTCKITWAFLAAQAADKCSVGVREDTQEYALN